MTDAPDLPTDPDRKSTLFVPRELYRRRRLVDASRALPILGLMLWFLPLLWTIPDEPMRASSVLVYLFVVWIALVVTVAALIYAHGRLSMRASRTQ